MATNKTYRTKTYRMMELRNLMTDELTHLGQHILYWKDEIVEDDFSPANCFVMANDDSVMRAWMRIATWAAEMKTLQQEWEQDESA